MERGKLMWKIARAIFFRNFQLSIVNFQFERAEASETKHCATCIHIRRKCDGNCGSCGHGVCTPGAADLNCKCIVCYDEDSGRYKYWEENKEVTRLLE